MPQPTMQIFEDEDEWNEDRSGDEWNDRRGIPRPRSRPRSFTHERAPEIHVDAEKNMLTLDASDAKFWFNNLHDDFLRRLRSHQRFSFIRAIYLAILTLHVAYDDLRVWNRLYGPAGAIAVVLLAKKSIWTLQVEVLVSGIDEIRWRLSTSPVRSTNALSGPASNDDITTSRQPTGRPYRENEPRIKGPERSSPARRNHSNTLDSASYLSTVEEGMRTLHGRRRSPLADPHDPAEWGQTGGTGGAGALPPPEFSVAGLEFKKAVQDESARIGTSGGIVTAVAMAALALPNVSQTHWVARSCWTSSMVTALLAVYFSSNQTWTISQLSSEQKLRAWIKDIDPEDDYEAMLQMNLRGEGVDSPSVFLDNIAPAPSSTITISAPSLLLSSSLLLLLSGMGVFLAFVWTRMIDTDAGTSSSRNVFITYIVTLGASLGTVAFFSLGRVAVPIRQSVVRNLRLFGIEARENSAGERGDRSEILARRRLPSTDDMQEMGDPQAADLEAKDAHGRTTQLLAAAENGDEAMVKQLLEMGADLEAKDIFGVTPLSQAAVEGYEEVVKQLLEKGADLEAKDADGRTPLVLAAQNWGEVKLLLEMGADREAKDHNGRTPLSWAAGTAYESGIEQLLEKGADLEAKDHNGRTPLSWAAGTKYVFIVELLLEKGADLEAKDHNGRTPLSWAARNGHLAVVKHLREKGASLASMDENGRTPLACKANMTVWDFLAESDLSHDVPVSLHFGEDESAAQDTGHAMDGLSGDETTNEIPNMEGKTQDKETEMQEEKDSEIQEENDKLTEEDSEMCR